MKCAKCGTEIRPIIVDALGREVKVTDIILWLRPVLNYRDGDVYLSTKKVMGYDPVVVIPRRFESTFGPGQFVYCIDATTLHTDSPVDIRGTVGERNPLIYKIASDISEVL